MMSMQNIKKGKKQTKILTIGLSHELTTMADLTPFSAGLEGIVSIYSPS